MLIIIVLEKLKHLFINIDCLFLFNSIENIDWFFLLLNIYNLKI